MIIDGRVVRNFFTPLSGGGRAGFSSLKIYKDCEIYRFRFDCGESSPILGANEVRIRFLKPPLGETGSWDGVLEDNEFCYCDPTNLDTDGEWRFWP